MDKRYEIDELTLLFQRIFATDDGKDLLSVLERKFDAPALTPNAAVDGIAIALLTQHRIGEQNVIKFIKGMINREVSKNDGRNATDRTDY